MSDSEIVRPFAEKPKTVSEFFVGSVRRLMQDNLDVLLNTTTDNKHVEVLHMIDADPKPSYLQYHYAYESIDRSTGMNQIGLIVAYAQIERSLRQQGLQSSRERLTRHYFDNGQGLDIVVRQDLAIRPPLLNLLDGMVEDPKMLDDPLDNSLTHTLKHDITTLRASTPVKPESYAFNLYNFIEH